MTSSPPAQAAARERPDYAGAMIALACGMAFMWTALFLAVMPTMKHVSGARDFVVYWATGQQLAHHANPYDPVVMGAIERAAGYAGKPGSYYMRNPPWSLPLALPLGFFSVQAAALPWSLFIFGLLVLSVRMLLKILGRPGGPVGLLGYAFPPALTCVIMGQTSLFLLLGLVLFLRLHRTRPFWAGAALWFCTLKPHVLLPFAVVLLVWIVVSRNWRILLGALAALAVSCGLTLCIDPSAFAQYLHWADRSGIGNEFIPCLSVALRDLVDPQAKWLVFVLCVPACLWALLYFRRHRQEWDWMEHGNLLVLISLVVAPYCWLYDQSLALPAVLLAVSRTRSRLALASIAALYLLVVIQPFYAAGLHSALYLWPAPAWLAWYWATRRLEADPDSGISSAAGTRPAAASRGAVHG